MRRLEELSEGVRSQAWGCNSCPSPLQEGQQGVAQGEAGKACPAVPLLKNLPGLPPGSAVLNAQAGVVLADSPQCMQILLLSPGPCPIFGRKALAPLLLLSSFDSFYSLNNTMS